MPLTVGNRVIYQNGVSICNDRYRSFSYCARRVLIIFVGQELRKQGVQQRGGKQGTVAVVKLNHNSMTETVRADNRRFDLLLKLPFPAVGIVEKTYAVDKPHS